MMSLQSLVEWLPINFDMNDICRFSKERCHYSAFFPSGTIVSMLKKEYSDLFIFAGLEPDQFQLILPLMEEVVYPAETIIFEQGQIASSLYILLEGEVHVCFKPYDGPPLTVARILPGGVFGWSAALGRDVYTSSAQSKTVMIAYRLQGEHLHQLCECHPDTGGILLERLARVIAERMRNTHPLILQILTEGVDPTGKSKNRSEEYVR